MPIHGETTGTGNATTGAEDTTHAPLPPASANTAPTGGGVQGYGGEVVLAASAPIPAPPMRIPDGQWALLISEIEFRGRPGDGEVLEWLEGCWVDESHRDDRFHDGDVVVRLSEPDGSRGPVASTVDVEMLLAYEGAWQRVGLWPAQGTDWPTIVVYTASAVMGLHTDHAECR